MRSFFILFFIFFSSTIIAQVYNGEIFIRDQSKWYLNQLYVTNLNDQKTVLTSIDGTFQIPAKAGDVIRFTSIITDRKDIKLTTKMLQNIHNFVELEIAYYEIQEIVLTNFKPSGNLRKDVLNLKNDDKKIQIKKAIGLPQPKGDGLPTQLPIVSFSGGGLTFGIQSIYDVLSGDQKRKERLYAYEKMKISTDKIKAYYGMAYFAELKIPNQLVDNFLQFVYSSDYIQPYIDNNNFEAVGFYIDKYLPIYQRRIKNTQLMNIIPSENK